MTINHFLKRLFNLLSLLFQSSRILLMKKKNLFILYLKQTSDNRMVKVKLFNLSINLPKVIFYFYNYFHIHIYLDIYQNFLN